MINTNRPEYDHLLASPFLAKNDDLGIPTIECTIGQRIFHKTFYDIGSGVNVMSKVTYEYLFGDEPLFPIYIYAIADSGPINPIFGVNSKRCHSKNTRSFCPC